MENSLTMKERLELNAKLQQKKNKLRKCLKEKGILKKDGINKFDKYSYFSEAQYKMLFTELFSECQLELKFNELSYDMFTGSEKQANGRMPKIEFTLFDIETGYGESSVITGEGIDKGDKAGYKAYTGALKYYLANTFMVATGDDAEKESPSAPMNEKKATSEQVFFLERHCSEDEIDKLKEKYNVQNLNDISYENVMKTITALKRRIQENLS